MMGRNKKQKRKATNNIKMALDKKLLSLNGSSLQLHPWRDGFHTIQKLLQGEKFELDKIKTVHVLLEEEGYEHVLREEEMIQVFETMSCNLRGLESVVIKLDVSPHFPLPSAQNPPITALTSLLMGEGQQNKIQFLTLIGLRLVGDDYDVNGLAEAIRIHPTMHSFAMKSCWFSNEEHLEIVKSALAERGTKLKHLNLIDNVIVEDVDDLVTSHYYHYESCEQSNEERPFWASHPIFSCLYPITCCI